MTCILISNEKGGRKIPVIFGRNNYSDSTMSLLFGNDYEATMMQSVTTHENGSKTYNSKFVYDPTIFYEKNQKGRLQ